MTTRFIQLTLRTSDVDAARAFYSAVLGDSAATMEMFVLHEAAVARGARPHWLGFLEVAELERSNAAFVELGAQSLGPPWINPAGMRGAMLRDPGGALVALAQPPTPIPSDRPLRAGTTDVAWCLLNAVDVERAKAAYASLFGWAFAPPLDLGELGVFHPFAWQAGGALVGSMSAIGARASVHPHWLFQLRVAALNSALALVRANGGTIAAIVTLPDGDRVAVCDDPQGAAFTLRECVVR